MQRRSFNMMLLFLIFLVVLSVAQEMSPYLQEKLSDRWLSAADAPEDCNNQCKNDFVCKSAAFRRWDKDSEIYPGRDCDNNKYFQCLPPNRFCTANESQGTCPAGMACIKHLFHVCSTAGVLRSATRCVFQSSPCRQLKGFLPSHKTCTVTVQQLNPWLRTDDSIERMEIRDKPSCGQMNHCPANMSCWLDSETYNDGLMTEYAERCTFNEDPCINVICANGSRCGIVRKMVEDPVERMRICNARGTTCDYLWPSREIATCLVGH